MRRPLRDRVWWWLFSASLRASAREQHARAFWLCSASIASDYAFSRLAALRGRRR